MLTVVGEKEFVISASIARIKSRVGVSRCMLSSLRFASLDPLLVLGQ